jgi:hypothetical protein
MPREIRSSEEFNKLIPKASQCRVVRRADTVKLKLRTPEYLYIYKTNEGEADDLLKSLKDVEVIELNPPAKEEKAETQKKKGTGKVKASEEKEPEREEEESEE